jgi:hypothetical protein
MIANALMAAMGLEGLYEAMKDYMPQVYDHYNAGFWRLYNASDGEIDHDLGYNIAAKEIAEGHLALFMAQLIGRITLGTRGKGLAAAVLAGKGGTDYPANCFSEAPTMKNNCPFCKTWQKIREPTRACSKTTRRETTRQFRKRREIRLTRAWGR